MHLVISFTRCILILIKGAKNMKIVNTVGNLEDFLQSIHNGIIEGDVLIDGIDGSVQLPANLRVYGSLTISNCKSLSLPENLYVKCCLNISNIEGLETLPWLNASDLVIGKCPNLSSLPENLCVETLYLYDCPALTKLPEYLVINNDLYLFNIPNIVFLPNTIHVSNNTQIAYCSDELGDFLFTKPASLDLGECVYITHVPL